MSEKEEFIGKIRKEKLEKIEEKKRLAQKLRHKMWKDYFYWVVGAFYFFQGFYNAGELLYVNKFLADTAGFDYGQIAAVISIINIPLYLKMFIGLLSDKVPLGKFGRRRPYILLGSLLYIPIFYWVSTFEVYNNTWVMGLL